MARLVTWLWREATFREALGGEMEPFSARRHPRHDAGGRGVVELQWVAFQAPGRPLPTVRLPTAKFPSSLPGRGFGRAFFHPPSSMACSSARQPLPLLDLAGALPTCLASFYIFTRGWHAVSSGFGVFPRARVVYKLALRGPRLSFL